jgi:PadR family transcriptional regulator AphA
MVCWRGTRRTFQRLQVGVNMHVRTLCLGALALGDASGYEIKKLFEEGVFSHFSEASFGSIYPALTKLTDDGLLTCQAHSQEGRPDKKVYSLTELGRKTFQEALFQPIQPDKYRSDFLFSLVFANQMPAARISEILNNKLEELKEELKRIEAGGGVSKAPSGDLVKEFGAHVTVSMIEFLEKNRSRIEALGCETETRSRTPCEAIG